jgi:hypothetical protein
LAVNVDPHRFVPALWVNDDFLDNLPNSLMGSQTAVLVRIREGLLQVPYLVALGIACIRVKLDCRRDDLGNRGLDLVAWHGEIEQSIRSSATYTHLALFMRQQRSAIQARSSQ